MVEKEATRSGIAGVVAVIVLLALNAISNPTTDPFAGKYKNNQAVSQADACGNGEM